MPYFSGSEEEYGKKKKAKYTIRCAGYQVVRDVAKHLHDELHELAGGLGKLDQVIIYFLSTWCTCVSIACTCTKIELSKQCLAVLWCYI